MTSFTPFWIWGVEKNSPNPDKIGTGKEVEMKKLLCVISLLVIFFVVGTASATQRVASRSTQQCGAALINEAKNLAVLAQTPEDLQVLIDTYWGVEDCDHWGNQWLSQYAGYAFGMKAYELWDELNSSQQSQVETIMSDLVQESSFFLSYTCGSMKGDTCSEDYAGMVMAIAMVKNLYPQVPVQGLNTFEMEYIENVFSVDRGFYSLVMEQKPWDESLQVKLYNHGGESPVYGLVILIAMNNAVHVYDMAGNEVPDYYRHPNALLLFRWVQSKAKSNGSAFLSTCHTVAGEQIACNDPSIARTSPKLMPGGRFIGSAARFGGYSFFDFVEVPTDGNFDIGRFYFYQVWNPMPDMPGPRNGGSRN